MDTEREYRVFCPPAGGIAAISQYRWHAPSVLASSDSELDQLVSECRRIHTDILTEMKREDEGGDLMQKQGYSFDVLFREGKGKLIELNGFGVRSGTGSCLFHWLRDMDVLYGKEMEIEVRISV